MKLLSSNCPTFVHHARKVTADFVCTHAGIPITTGIALTLTALFFLKSGLLQLLLIGFVLLLFSSVLVIVSSELKKSKIEFENYAKKLKDSLDKMESKPKASDGTGQSDLSTGIQTNLLPRTNENEAQQMSVLVGTDKLATLGAMVAGVSHEMASPMSAALTMSQIIVEKIEAYERALADGNKVAADKAKSAMIDSAHIITRNIRQTNELLQSFKSVSVDRASERRRRFDVAKEVRHLVHSIRAAKRRNDIEITIAIADGLYVDGYPGRVGQIITNLVNNAYTHGHPYKLVPGVISIRVDPAQTNHEVITLDFWDSGVGVPESIKQELFKPFQTSKLATGGSGIGLAISRHLAREMGGPDFRPQHWRRDNVSINSANDGPSFSLK